MSSYRRDDTEKQDDHTDIQHKNRCLSTLMVGEFEHQNVTKTERSADDKAWIITVD